MLKHKKMFRRYVIFHHNNLISLLVCLPTEKNRTTMTMIKVKLSHTHHTGAKGERGYSSDSLFTSPLDGGEWLASGPGHPLHLENEPRYPLDRRLGGPQSWSGYRD
jgi:hypothetical protein